MAELTEALKPSEERVGADEIVTMNVNDPNLPQVGLLARVVAQLGLLMP